MATTTVEPAVGAAVATPEPSPPDVTPARARELEARRRTQTRLRAELLIGMVRKDFRLKYQGSVLGFLWSLINPLFLFAVYGFVFGVVLGTGIPAFPIYVMSGLLTWNLFAGSLGAATGSVVGNAGLVKKVRFPLQVLPLSSVGFALVHYVLQMSVLTAVVLAAHRTGIGLNTLLVVPAIAVAVVFTAGCCFAVSALNVRYRDTAHLVELALIAWFWLTPTIYASGLIAKLVETHPSVPTWVYRIYFADPMAIVVATMQRALYGPQQVNRGGQAALADPGYGFYLEQLGVAAIVAAAAFFLGRRLFRRMQADFAEEL